MKFFSKDTGKFHIYVSESSEGLVTQVSNKIYGLRPSQARQVISFLTEITTSLEQWLNTEKEQIGKNRPPPI